MLGDRIREARIARGITQVELAKLTGLAKSTIAGYEINNSEPDIARLQRLCDVLKVDANYLLQDEIVANVTNDEMDLLKTYRTLDRHGKRIVRVVAKEEAARMAASEPDEFEIARQAIDAANAAAQERPESTG